MSLTKEQESLILIKKYPMYFLDRKGNLFPNKPKVKNVFKTLTITLAEYWCDLQLTYTDIENAIINEIKPFIKDTSEEIRIFQYELKELSDKELTTYQEICQGLVHLRKEYLRLGLTLIDTYKLEEKALTELIGLTDDDLAKHVYSNFTHDFYNSTNNICFLCDYFNELLTKFKK